MSTTRSEYNYNLAVEAVVRKVISEMAIKNANDSVVSTEEIDETAALSTVSDHEISSDNMVSNNNDAEKTKKDRRATHIGRLIMLEGILHISHFHDYSMKLMGVAMACIEGHIGKTQMLELGPHIFEG